MSKTIPALMDVFMVVWLLAATVGMVAAVYVLIKVLKDTMRENSSK